MKKKKNKNVHKLEQKEYSRTVLYLCSECDYLLACFEGFQTSYGKRVFKEKVNGVDGTAFCIPCYDYFLFEIREKRDIISLINSAVSINDLIDHFGLYSLFFMKDNLCIGYSLERDKELTVIDAATEK